MRVIVEGRPFVLRPADVIGQGGEALVYRKGPRAIKIFQGLDADALARKAAKLANYPRGLPDPVLAPLARAHDESGALVGYAMRFLDGALDGQKLTSKKQREGVLDAVAVNRWLVELGRLLASLHALGVVVGDLNDGNVLCAGGAPYLIDTDSYQFGGHPCTVAHEKYLDPRLYGVDLAKDTVLDERSDWYAFAVLAFSVLLLVHPYGGTHPSLGTLARRAQAGVSVLSPEVTRPKVAARLDILPDGLLGWFRDTFEGQLRQRLPELLLSLSWVRCACGLEHARPRCPACASRGVVHARPVAQNHGRVRWVPLPGQTQAARCWCARVQGGLRLVWSDGDGVLRREDGAALGGPLAQPGAFAFTGRLTWIAQGAQLVAVDAGRVVQRRTVGTLAAEAVFDANSRGVYYLDGDYLIDGATETRVGTILEGATAIRVGERRGYGYYRAGQLTHHFLFRVGRPGVTALSLPPIRGRLVALEAYFDGEEVLVAWRESAEGRETAHLHLIDALGNVRASLAGEPESSVLLQSPGGFAIASGRILRATDAGVLSVVVDQGTFTPGALFLDAEPFVAEGDEILPGPAGSLYVIGSKGAGQLCLA